jgi:hypothetical protein
MNAAIMKNITRCYQEYFESRYFDWFWRKFGERYGTGSGSDLVGLEAAA